MILTIPSACFSILMAQSNISEFAEACWIFRASAIISKTAKGLAPAVSAKPLADVRDDRFIIVTFHYPPGISRE